MNTSPKKPPSPLHLENKNRTNLQTIIGFSLSLVESPSVVSRSDHVINLKISARQKWSAQPDCPVTITTYHTPLDVEVPGKAWTGRSLKANLRVNGRNRYLIDRAGKRICYRPPYDNEWPTKFAYVTIPSLESDEEYTVIRELDLQDLYDKDSIIPSPLSICLDDLEEYLPQKMWWQWGDLEDDLKAKRLEDRSDPLVNDKSREEERKKLDEDIVLPFGAWKDEEDEEGNELMWLEFVVDDTPIEINLT